MSHWALRVNVSREEWISFVKEGGYPEQRGVVYSIVKVDKKGHVVETDCDIVNAKFNICFRLREAINQKMIYSE